MSETPRSRRSNQEGSVPRQRKDGRWQINLWVSSTTTGKPYRKTFYGQTRADVVAKVQQYRNSLAAGLIADPKKTTFEGWLKHWLPAIAKPRLARQTLDGYTGYIRKWVYDTAEGAVKLEDLQPMHLERIYSRMRKEKKSETTVLQVHHILSKALKDAVGRGMLGINPAAKIDAPTAADFDPNVISSEKARELIQGARTDEDWGASWILNLAFGPRQAERLGLCREDLDFERGILSFERQLVRLAWRHGCEPGADGAPSCGRKRGGNCPDRHDGGYRLLKPKSKKGKRQWPMPQPIAEALRAQLNYQDQWKAAAGSSWKTFLDEEGRERRLVFTQRDGSPIPAWVDRKAWRAFTAQHGITEMRGHDARHTAATVLLELGVDQRVVMELMGWSQISMVARYQHVMDPMRESAASQVADTLFRAPAPAAREAAVIDLATRRALRQA